MAGSREEGWGKDKHFREGQAKQVLSDLFFDYLDLVERLKPRVAIAENVKGMILGNAKGYTKMIMARFRKIGYRPQLFLLNGADCGVPQRRERVFFVAIRDDITAPPLKLAQKHRWIASGEACQDLQVLTQEELIETAATASDKKWWPKTEPGSDYGVAAMRETGKPTGFSIKRIDGDIPSNTLV